MKHATIDTLTVYRAFIRHPGTKQESPVYPHRKNRITFPTIDAARQRLEKVSRKSDADLVGIIYTYQDGERQPNPYQIAL